MSGPPYTTFVLDTSVLLSDPGAMGRFAEHEVVLPLVVISELEGKRDHPELGWFARQALRVLDDLRIEHGRLDQPIPLAGGTLRVELNHSGAEVLPAGFRVADNDSRILTVAANLAAEGFDVVLISKDLPLRVKAAAIGLTAQEYRAELAVNSGHTGGQELGYLRGDTAEKVGPWAQAVFDTLGALVPPEVVEEVMERGLLEVLPLTHIRGRSLHDAFVIVDEAQSLERGVLLTVLSRLGRSCRSARRHAECGDQIVKMRVCGAVRRPDYDRGL